MIEVNELGIGEIVSTIAPATGAEPLMTMPRADKRHKKMSLYGANRPMLEFICVCPLKKFHQKLPTLGGSH